MIISRVITDNRKLKGMCFHNFKDGLLHNQGKVLKVYDDYIVAELYEWIVGYPNGTKNFKFSDFESMKFIWYKNNKEMVEHYRAHDSPIGINKYEYFV